MNDIDELTHVLEVLKRFDLPISPILEYAIREKIETLSSPIESHPIVAEPESTDGSDNTKEKEVLFESKKKITTIRVIKQDGSVIEQKKAAQTMSDVIREIGNEKVYDLHIPMDGMHLVTKGGNPNYPSAQYDVGNGYFVNTHSSTVTKRNQLEKIFSRLNLAWKVEIVESI
jgi:hypothetical protein